MSMQLKLFSDADMLVIEGRVNRFLASCAENGWAVHDIDTMVTTSGSGLTFTVAVRFRDHHHEMP